MRSWGPLFLCILGLLAPISLHAAPETSFEKLFDTHFSVDVFSPRFNNADDLGIVRDHAASFANHDNDDGPEQYLRTVFSYVNRKLGFTQKDVSLKPMIGLDIFRTFSVSENMTITPEIYAVYRYEDSANFLSQGHDFQAGMGFAVSMTESISGRLSFDSDLQPGARDHRAVFSVKCRW